ncbi:S-adenosyl-L-methionine-dependent methyltransferase [Ascobolus immersus RN42]|uniref:S-adenosyl-L-methionine-dependent methyltransferase n=1 Tax=Ascobolus immersus RN42 TaxID=1160509 RepID=A0A3N4IB96_ASCIM|nr:S-adenosyl-L-methionine-dependent methyltransferase [Ascobolus immersus RN42]
MAPHRILAATTLSHTDREADSSTGEHRLTGASSLEQETLQSLANTVQSSVSVITDYLKAHNLPEPTFGNLTSPNLPFVPELKEAKRVLLEATSAIEAIAQFNKFDYVGRLILLNQELTALKVAVDDFDVPNAIPIDEEVHISDICKRTGCLDEYKLLSSIRMLTQNFIFKETKLGYFAHTIHSVTLRDRDIAAYIGWNGSTVMTTSTKFTDAMKLYPNSKDPSKSAFSLAHNTDQTLFEWITKPEQQETLAGFNKGMIGTSKYSIEALSKAYPWNTLGHGTLIDVGGGQGHVSLAILSANPELKITVQDLPEVIEHSKESSPARGKVTFESHNMFAPQPKKADAYFFRHVFHDHTDDACIKAIRATLHHLRSAKNGTGGRIIVAETIMQPLDVRPPTGRQACAMNMKMCALQNGRERTVDEFDRLFKAADARFKTKAFITNGPVGSDVIEAWIEEDN